MRETSSQELFVIPDSAGPVLYAPLGGKIARVNESAAQLALRFAQESCQLSELNDNDRTVIQELSDHGFFEEHFLPSHETDFRPAQVTLFPTNRCNLRCSYCYAFGGEGGGNGEPLQTMKLEVAQRAIDLVAKNAKELADEGKPYRNFLVSIHGNGEPFCAFDLLKKIVWYAQDVSERIGFPVVLNTATNGVMTNDQLEFLVANFNNVNISFDGLPEFQNTQRPLAGGAGSFESVNRTMKRLMEANVSFGVRTTVTDAMVNRMADIAAFVADEYPSIEQLHFEPVWECGRCVKSADSSPLAEDFIRNYRAALAVAREKGLHLVYSGARHDMLVDAFCKVSSGSFTVTPTGDVTACYEVSYRSDPRSERFFFGRFNEDRGDFEFDQEKLRRLSLLSVRAFSFCHNCFCKWHCAGDCTAKVLDGIEPAQHHGSIRCDINRALTSDQIKQIVEWGESHG